MTNEAQTNIVVARAKKMLPMMKSMLGESIERYAEFYKKSLLNMAEWKDQQFKEYLEKKIEPFIRTNASPQGTYQEGFDDGYTSAIDEITNELFGE